LSLSVRGNFPLIFLSLVQGFKNDSDFFLPPFSLLQAICLFRPEIRVQRVALFFSRFFFS